MHAWYWLKLVLSKVVSSIGNYQLLIWIDSLVTRFIVFECSVFNWLKEIQINIEMQFSISLHKLTVRSTNQGVTNTCYFEGLHQWESPVPSGWPKLLPHTVILRNTVNVSMQTIITSRLIIMASFAYLNFENFQALLAVTLHARRAHYFCLNK